MELKIESAVRNDLPEISELYVETIQSSCSKDYDEQQILAWTSSVKKKERWETALATQYFLIARIDAQIVGFASIKNGNYVDFMYVHRHHLRKGIAARLFAELEKEAKHLGHTFLTSDVSKTALPFFASRGFIVVHENHNIIEGVEIVNYRMVKRVKAI